MIFYPSDGRTNAPQALASKCSLLRELLTNVASLVRMKGCNSLTHDELARGESVSESFFSPGNLSFPKKKEKMLKIQCHYMLFIINIQYTSQAPASLSWQQSPLFVPTALAKKMDSQILLMKKRILRFKSRGKEEEWRAHHSVSCTNSYTPVDHEAHATTSDNCSSFPRFY